MEYLKKIVGERTSLDGTVLIAVGVVCVLYRQEMFSLQ